MVVKRQLAPIGLWDSNPFKFSQGVKSDCRSVVFIAGQTAMDSDGKIVGKGVPGEQVRQIFENMRLVLEDAGATFDNVTKLNAYFVNIDHLDEYSKIMSNYFPISYPAQTVVEIKRLALPDLLIEVEAYAVL